MMARLFCLAAMALCAGVFALMCYLVGCGIYFTLIAQ